MNSPREYAWGSITAIPELMGLEPTGKPQAELWLGTHPGSPSAVVHEDGSEEPLARWLVESGNAEELPFLFKILAAAHPLSLQVHPSRKQARLGFTRETQLGIPLTAPNRNYKDQEHKPEIIIALSDTFDALCGFRSIARVRDDLLRVIQSAASPDLALLEKALLLLRDAPEASPEERERVAQEARQEFIVWLFSHSAEAEDFMRALEAALRGGESSLVEEYPNFKTFLHLREEYPEDPGAAVSLLLNRVTLTAGESLYLPAGNMHAYLHGLGVEVMASSDNVLRGGLTTKHVDTEELVNILDFSTLDTPRLTGEGEHPGVMRWVPDVSDFQVWGIETLKDRPARVQLPGSSAVGFVTRGEITINYSGGSVSLQRGESFAGIQSLSGAEEIEFEGDGQAFVATTGVVSGAE
ncbi:mannose-6-phosphate isomerase, class I [Lysinibacter sp. HNR]|uniref:mannose-6-phosphate isomerase, class I n=1 Tax=Lysinibacter sp. HNR TaxID=3031408 RepID=UPI002436019B|nr:mannose-6-phosphate isomerase, class I [Lysinibacter sp. HNR]WGD38101.1 mannose-6-phosphate isomerase, class I [Lysinibacter sp. HNR]